MLLALLRADEGQIDNRIIEGRDHPEGHTHWTLKLPEDKAVELGYVESIARETVRQSLKKRTQALEEQCVAHPELSGEFVARMEDALNLDSHRGYTY